MSNQLENNLAHAFAEESKGAVRNKAYVLKAEKDGYPELARLFKAVSNAKSIHARRFLNLIPDNCPVCKAVPGRFKKVS